MKRVPRVLLALLLLVAWRPGAARRDGTRSENTLGTAQDTGAPIDGATLTLTTGTTGQVGLSWSVATDPGGINHYEVRASNAGTQTPPADCNSGNTVTGCNDPTGTTCTATGLTDYSDIAFRVCAVDAAGNMSAGITQWEQPWAESNMVTFDGTNENATAADSAAFECANHLTMIAVLRVQTCASGVPCDDDIASKGTNALDSYSMLVEFNAAGWVPRLAVTGLAAFYQHNVAYTLNRWVIQVMHYDGTQVDGGDAGSDANAERLQASGVMCSNATPPVCGVLADETGGSFNGTIAATISDQATAFLIGGFDTVSNFNLAGDLMTVGVWCDSSTRTQVQNCMLNASNKPLNWNTMSKRTSGGTGCDVIFAHPAAWYTIGETGDTAATTFLERSTSAAGNATQQNMEAGDTTAHSFN